MTRWEAIQDERAQVIWDQTLARFDDCSPFQSYAWGQYRRGLGWEPHRWAAFDERDNIVAMFQAYVRKHRQGFGLLWSEGGPVGDLSVCDQTLQKAIEETVDLKRLYCRFRCDRPRGIEDVWRLNANGWQVAGAKLNSNCTVVLDLTKDEKDLLAATARTWRGNLRRAARNNLTTRQWHDPNVAEILAVFHSMQQAKGLEEQHSREEIEQLLANLGTQLVLYRCDDEQGRMISLGGALVMGRCANLWLLSTNEQGRNVRASYSVFWSLLQHCQRVGVRSYDLGGVDPVTNAGVYQFKKGSGAKPVELLGEWDWAPQPWLRRLGNLAINNRSRVRRVEKILNKSEPRVTGKHAVPASSRAPEPLLSAESN